jgi:hypothetical protein
VEITDVVSVLPLGASNLGIAGISAGAALLGAAVGGVVTWRVEKSRQTHQETTRKQQDLDLAHGLARVLSDDLMHELHQMETEHEEQQWYTREERPGLGIGERQVLYRHLTEPEFVSVISGLSAIEAVARLRGPASTGDDISKVSVETLARGIRLVKGAHGDLSALAVPATRSERRSGLPTSPSVPTSERLTNPTT